MQLPGVPPRLVFFQKMMENIFSFLWLHLPRREGDRPAQTFDPALSPPISPHYSPSQYAVRLTMPLLLVTNCWGWRWWRWWDWIMHNSRVNNTPLAIVQSTPSTLSWTGLESKLGRKMKRYSVLDVGFIRRNDLQVLRVWSPSWVCLTWRQHSGRISCHWADSFSCNSSGTLHQSGPLSSYPL